MTDQIELIENTMESTPTVKSIIETLKKLDPNMSVLANDEPIVFLGKGNGSVNGPYVTIISQSHFEKIVEGLKDEMGE